MKYSIVVPVYGTEKYIHECVNSILNQTETDFEVILVDDKSPDKCPEICDMYQACDSRVKVIHKQQNEGLGEARNTGISEADGEYILFVDSDDTIDNNWLETCSYILNSDTDIAVFGLTRCYEASNGKIRLAEKCLPTHEICCLENERVSVFYELNKNKLFPFACNKVYRTEFVKTCCVPFERTKLIEDFLFNIVAFEKAKKIQLINSSFYNYRKPSHETLASQFNDQFFYLALRKYELELSFLRNSNCKDEQVFQLVHHNMVKHFISATVRNRSRKAGYSYSQQLEQIKLMINNQHIQEMLEEYLPDNWFYRMVCNWIRKRKKRHLFFLAMGVEFAQKYLLPIYRRVLN